MRQSVNAKASLTARMTVRAVTKVGVSDPAVCEWKCRRSTDKSSLVREDRDGRTSGAPVVTPVAQLGSYVRNG